MIHRHMRGPIVSVVLVASMVAMLVSWMNWSVGVAATPVTIWGDGRIKGQFTSSCMAMELSG